jgi:hypothetical protein
MSKILAPLLFSMAAVSFASSLNPIDEYSVEDLYRTSSAVIDGTIFHMGLVPNEEQDELYEKKRYSLKVDLVLKNDTESNIGKRNTTIDFVYCILRSDLEHEHASWLNGGDTIRLFLPSDVIDINERINITSKNQIHHELYGVVPPVPEVDIAPPESEKPSTPKWYWLTGGVVSLLAFGGVTFRFGYRYGFRNRK